jgi:hypothetical protein
MRKKMNKKVSFIKYFNVEIKTFILLLFILSINSCSKNKDFKMNDSTIYDISSIDPRFVSSLPDPNPSKTSKINAKIKIMINDNELNYNDVELNYFETTFELNKNEILMDLSIIIKNPELTSQLKEIINPMIYFEIDNRKYSPKGIIYERPVPSADYEIKYFLHETGRLYFFHNSNNDSTVQFFWREDRQ